MLQIDQFRFEKYFQLFKTLVESESKTVFVSFPSNRYTEETEGYKDSIYEKARNELCFWNWKKEQIGTGKIIQYVVSAIKLDKNENNLVDWRIISKFEEKAKNSDVGWYEGCLFDLFLGFKEEESFRAFVGYFGRNYPLIAYLFFIKDKAQYMPISPTHFDKAFKKLGVISFQSSHRCSWDNYHEYNLLLNQVRDLLINKGIKDVSLLNAHSFVWMISDIEDEITKRGISTQDMIQIIEEYEGLGRKDREIVSKARIGQGLFRDRQISYWGKCSVTGCDNLGILIASHIKPWEDCDYKEAIDMFNGLLLLPNMDKLFDMGLVSFDDKGKIIISTKLKAKDLRILAINPDMKLAKIENRHKSYLAYHRDHVFIKS